MILPIILTNFMVKTGSVLKGRYEIRREIKRGGMGAVFEAYDRLRDELIAVKQTFNSTDIHANLFFREASLLARLNHRALPKVHDYFTEGDDHFLTMDFIAGEDLLALLKKSNRPFATEQVMEWADPLLDALDYLHTHKPRVVHRDIKPENIRLTPEMKVMLLDFGLAKNLTTELQANSIVGGTRGYAPPEQFTPGEQVDSRVDLYAFGATLYQLLTATWPPDSMERLTWIHTRKTDPLRPANELNPQISAPLAEVIAKAMSLDRNQRYNSAKEMREALLVERQEAERRRQAEELQRTQAGQKQREREAQWQADYERLQRENTELQRRLAEQQQQVKRPPAREPDNTTVAKIIPPAVIDDPPTIVRVPKAGSVPALLSGEFTTVTLNARGEVTERRRGQAKYFIEDIDGVKLEMVHVPGNSFLRGSTDSEVQQAFTEAERYNEEAKLEWFSCETPQHRVTVPGFFMGRFQVTQAQWRVVAQLPKVKAKLEPEPSSFKGDDLLPVEQVSWEDAQEFCARLQQKTGKAYRLPSEAEWEYACRAGTTTPFAFGETITPEIVNYDGNYPYASAPKGEYRQKTVPVGSLGVANAFGLYDLHGNVWEWCEDVWHDNYNGAPTDGSAWTTGGDQSYRMLRGGSWSDYGWYCRAANRVYNAPGDRDYPIGFRVVVSARTP